MSLFWGDFFCALRFQAAQIEVGRGFSIAPAASFGVHFRQKERRRLDRCERAPDDGSLRTTRVRSGIEIAVSVVFSDRVKRGRLNWFGLVWG